MKIINRTIFPALKSALVDQRVIVLTGMRRVGKTTSLKWLLSQVPSANKVYLDLERHDLREVFKESNYELILNYLRNLGMNSDKPMTVALDEIQYAPNLPSAVKYLYDHHGIKFLLTGSSSYYLKHLFSESLAGRKVVFEMFPLGFGEFLDFREVAYRKRQTFAEMRFDPHEYERLKSYYDDFINFGGLPAVVLEPRNEVKREILKDIFSSYINLDVRALADFRKIGELEQLLKALVIRMGNKLDLSKLSQIIGISRPTLNEYLEFLEKTYVISRLPVYSSVDKVVSLSKKIFFHDNGIASVLGQPGEGALFENAIFNQLREYGTLSYLYKGNDYEIDFIVSQKGNPVTALEVKLHPVEKDKHTLFRNSEKNEIKSSFIIGKNPSPGFNDFIWGGSIP